MDVSLLSLLTFILTTIGYFVIGKQRIIIDDNVNLNTSTSPSAPPDAMYGGDSEPVSGFHISSNNWASGIAQYYSSTFPRLGLYLLTVTLVQLMLNIGYLIGKCGGNIGNNIGTALLYTFIPWIFIFGIMIAVLVVYPGFKSAFSDVIGYFVISSSAHDLLTDILIDVDTNKAIESATSMPGKTQEEMKLAADTIVKICGNKGVLINEMNPENFMNIWNIMKPLTKFSINPELDETIKRQELLDLVTLKDNIGEAFWYIYSAILVSSIVYYNLSSTGCVKDVVTMKKEHEKYVSEQENIDKKKAVANQVNYTMS